jgi:hypothetical protein
MKLYTILPTYRTTVANRCSRNLGSPSHPPFVAYMGQAESLPPLGRDLPELEKACADPLSFGFYVG